MRTFWITITILIAGATIVLFFIPSHVPASGTESESNSAIDSGEPVEIPAEIPAEISPSETASDPVATAGVREDSSTTPEIDSADKRITKGLDQKIKGATIRPGRLVEQDGAISADGKYLIRGAGTKESPYEVTWELLMSASDTFIPRLGEKEIPQRIAMLNGSHIRISGYIAFPLVTTETDECLVMLNQWDGCCIGVPPSPYDAIEVKLSIPSENTRRHAVRVGTIDGIFHIDPYVVERWLVGLYTMDEAILSTEM